MKNSTKGLAAIGLAAAIAGGTYLATQEEQFGAGVRAPIQLKQHYIDVAATYGVSAADDSKRVGEYYAIGTDTLESSLVWAWKRWKVEGMPYGVFRTRNLGAAIVKNVAWLYESDENIKRGLQNAYSFADFTNASGCWKMNVTAPLPRGGLRGQSSFGHYDESQTDQVFASCEFEMVDSLDWWPFAQTERRMFETPNSSLATPDNGSYQEGITVENIHLTGPFNWSGGAIKRTGLYARRLGECAYLNQINVAGFDYGIMLNGGVPVTAGTITAFFNRIGVALFGCWGMTFSFQTISGDQNEELLGSHPGYGDEAGGRIFGGLLKDEDGLHAQSAKTPYRWQTALYLEGQYMCFIGVISTARGGITQDAMVLLNPRMVNGTPQGSVLNIGAASGFSYRTLVHNLMTGERVASPGDYQGFSFQHYANGNRYVLNGQAVTPTACACPPLGGITGPGNYNYTACTPKKATGSGTTTPPTGCTWVGTEACTPCAGGTQTCTTTYASSVAGCTPTTTRPANTTTTKPCTPPPPSITMTAFKSDCVEAGKVRLPGAAVDADPASFWMGCASMTATGSQWVKFDLGATRTVASITFNAPSGYGSSFPPTFTVQTSTDNASWSTPVTRTGGMASTAPIGVSCRYVWIKCASANNNWWGIASVSVQ